MSGKGVGMGANIAKRRALAAIKHEECFVFRICTLHFELGKSSYPSVDRVLDRIAFSIDNGP